MEVRILVLTRGISGNVEETPFIDCELEKLGIALVNPAFIVPKSVPGAVMRQKT